MDALFWPNWIQFTPFIKTLLILFYHICLDNTVFPLIFVSLIHKLLQKSRSHPKILDIRRVTKQVPHWGPTNIKCHGEKWTSWVCLPLVCIYSSLSFVLRTPHTSSSLIKNNFFLIESFLPAPCSFPSLLTTYYRHSLPNGPQLTSPHVMRGQVSNPYKTK